MKSPYPQYDVLDEFDHWDEKTQAVIRKRLTEVPAITFFTDDEARLLAAVADRILPQDDRPPNQRVPIVPFIDEMLANDDTDGFREPDMPWAQEAWRQGIAGVDETSRVMHDRSFLNLSTAEQDGVLATIQQGSPPGQTWKQLPAKQFFRQLVEQIAGVYYAHPQAWSEIGWGGPASPRGYVRTGYGMRDPWEAVERGTASSVALVREKTKQETSGRGAGGALH